MRPEDLRTRTRNYALEVVALCDRLPPDAKYQEIAGQLRRAANSVAANYRAAGRGRTHAEFTAKIGSVLEEADESQHWLEMLQTLGVSDQRLRRSFVKQENSSRSSPPLTRLHLVGT